MARRSRRLAALLLVATGAAVVVALPPAAIRIAAPADPLTVAGAFHVHSTRSDGRETIDQIAADASRAGMRFVIFTDHGDGTAPPEPPSYRSSVLCIDGVEISTSGGHYAVVGLPQAPYPLAGDPHDVVEDVHRLGGFGFVAHGDSPKTDLRWNDWDAPVDGVEWLNLDSVWRAARPTALVRALLGYWLRPPEALASLASRPESMLRRWDTLSRLRRVVGIAATDSHGAFVPSYETSFRTLSTHVQLTQPLTGDAALDARAIIEALKEARHYTVLDALAAPAAFQFRVRGGTLEANVAAPPRARLVIFKDGAVWKDTGYDNLRVSDLPPGVYRAEVWLQTTPGDRPLPWIVSNPIAVGIAIAEAADVSPPAIIELKELVGVARALVWEVEHDPSSSGAIARGEDGALEFHYSLGGGKPYAQVVALAAPVTNEIGIFDRIVVRARADHPVRVALQLRAKGSGNPPRWQRSIYLDSAAREVTIPFSALRPVVGLNATDAGPLTPDAIGALLLVVDTNNTRPGTSGAVTFTTLAYAR
jgi:hypothetical protein